MNQFNPGDRVVVVAGPISEYIGGTGTVIKMSRNSTWVDADSDFRRKIEGFVSKGDWHFMSGWTLELIDDSKSYVPEDWS